jgi:hypothetical protein
MRLAGVLSQKPAWRASDAGSGATLSGSGNPRSLRPTATVGQLERQLRLPLGLEHVLSASDARLRRTSYVSLHSSTRCSQGWPSCPQIPHGQSTGSPQICPQT